MELLCRCSSLRVYRASRKLSMQAFQSKFLIIGHNCNLYRHVYTCRRECVKYDDHGVSYSGG